MFFSGDTDMPRVSNAVVMIAIMYLCVMTLITMMVMLMMMMIMVSVKVSIIESNEAGSTTALGLSGLASGGDSESGVESVKQGMNQPNFCWC